MYIEEEQEKEKKLVKMHLAFPEVSENWKKVTVTDVYLCLE